MGLVSEMFGVKAWLESEGTLPPGGVEVQHSSKQGASQQLFFTAQVMCALQKKRHTGKAHVGGGHIDSTEVDLTSSFPLPSLLRGGCDRRGFADRPVGRVHRRGARVLCVRRGPGSGVAPPPPPRMGMPEGGGGNGEGGGWRIRRATGTVVLALDP